MCVLFYVSALQPLSCCAATRAFATHDLKITTPLRLFVAKSLLFSFNLFLSIFSFYIRHFQAYSKMSALSGPATTSEDARVVIEALARLKGCFTDAFRREAEEEEENGRPGMLQAIKGGEEIRKDLANSLTR
jgi:hypothetical protein